MIPYNLAKIYFESMIMSQNVETTNKILWNCYFNGKK